MNERKIKKHEENIAKIKKQIMFLEAVKIQKDYVGVEYMGRQDSSKALPFDLNRLIISTLFNELFNDFIKNNFYLILNDDYVNYYQFSTLINEKVIISFSDSEKLYWAGELTDSICYLRKTLDTQKIDIIKLLIENKQYDLITKIVISDEIDNASKIKLIERIIENNPYELQKIFSNVPKDYLFINSETAYYDHIKSLINKNISLLKADKKFIEQTIIKCIKQNCTDEWSRFNARSLVAFFVEHNLVDMNTIVWDNGAHSSAAAAFSYNNNHLFEYLYKLDSYNDLNKKTRDNSDEFIMKAMLQRSFYYLEDLFEMVNFQANPDKLRFLSDKLVKINENKKEKISSKEIEKIIYLFLRKTKKEDYKEMLKVIEELRMNMNPVAKKEARGNLTRILKDFNNKLLEDVPAKTIVGDVPAKTIVGDVKILKK